LKCEKFAGDSLSLNFFFHGHFIDHLTSRLEELIRDSNVIVVEQEIRMTDGGLYESLLNELSQGKPVVEDILAIFSERYASIGRNKFDKKFLESISGTKIQICLEDSPLTENDHEVLIESEPLSPHVIPDPRESMRRYELQATYHRRRDMALCDQIIAIRRDHPRANILVMRGAVHQRSIEKFLKGRREQFKSFHPYEPYVLVPITADILSKVEAGEPVTRKDFLMADVETVEMVKRFDDPWTATESEAVLRQIEESIQTMDEEQLTQYLKKAASKYENRHRWG